jgi:hypothetical protein
MAQELTTLATVHILDQLKEGVIVVEADGTIQYLNQSALNLLALDQEPTTLYEAVAPYESWQELLHNDGLSYLYIDSGRVEIQTSLINWNDKPARQLILSSGEPADWNIAEPTRLRDQLASLNRISLQLGSTLRRRKRRVAGCCTLPHPRERREREELGENQSVLTLAAS